MNFIPFYNKRVGVTSGARAQSKAGRFFFFAAGIFLFFLFFLAPRPAYAAWPSLFSIAGITGPAVVVLVEIISAIILAIMGALIKIASLLVVFGLWLDKFLIAPDSSGFIIQGWVIFRDLANLGFVLGIIIIAIATILRYKNYSAQSLLLKLVAAALLVNFSLVLAIPFVQLSHSFSEYFLQSIVGGTSSTTDSQNSMFSQAALKITAVFDMGPVFSNITAGSNAAGAQATSIGGETVSAALVNNIIGAVFAIIIGAIVAFTLLGLGVVLFVRFFFLSVLLMISPVVWLLWIFPSTSKHFSDWWEKFIHWNLFAPAVLFFLDLAMGLSSSQLAAQTKSDMGQLSGGTSFGGLLLNNIMTPLIVVALILAGMKAASALGVKGGEIATGAAGKVTDFTKKKAGDWGSRGGSRLMQTKVGQNVVGGAGRVLGKVPIIGDTLHQKVIEGQQAVEKRANRQTEDARGRFERYSDQQLRAAWRSGDARDRAAMLDLLASKNKLGLLDDLATNKDYLGAYGTLRRGGNGKAVGDIAKRRGMSEDMMVLATGGSVYEKDKDGRIKTDASGKPIEITYQGAAEKFYGSLNGHDWESLAKTSGEALLKGEPILGFNKEQSELIGEHYIKNILNDETGKAISGTAPGLKDSKSLDALYEKMLTGTVKRYNEMVKDSDAEKLLDEAIKKADGNREKMLEAIQSSIGLAPEKISEGDKDRLERQIKRLRKSMASALGGFHEFGGESGDEKKGGDDKEKKSEGKK